MIDPSLVEKTSPQLRKMLESRGFYMHEADVTFYRSPDVTRYDHQNDKHICRTELTAVHKPSGIEITVSSTKISEPKLANAALAALAAIMTEVGDNGEC